MATPNLAIAHIAASQNQKEVTANAAFDALDTAMTDELSVPMADTNQTLSTAQALGHLVFVATGALTADRNLVVPTNRKLYVLSNATTGGHNVTLTTAAGTGVAVAAADGYRFAYCDGVNVVRVS